MLIYELQTLCSQLAMLISQAVSLTLWLLGSVSVLACYFSREGGFAEGPARRDTKRTCQSPPICFLWQSRTRVHDNQSAHPTLPPHSKGMSHIQPSSAGMMMAGCVVPSSGRHCKHTDGEMGEWGGEGLVLGETPDNYLKSGDWIPLGPSAFIWFCLMCRTSRVGHWCILIYIVI